MKRNYHPRVASGICAALAAVVVLGIPAQHASGQGRQVENPYSPAYGHSYRHGVMPTSDAWRKMKAWEATHATTPEVSPLASSDTLSFHGGVDGIGVTSSTPGVYLVFYGSQWTSGGDPNGAATYLQNLFAGIGTGGEHWSGVMTQYCDGSNVAYGATSCPDGAPLVGYPLGGALKGVWFDTSAAAPSNATVAQLQAEAVAAAAHFGNTSGASNRYVQYIVASPSGTHPDGFGPGGNFCAWHGFAAGTAYGDIAYANLPYVTDLGSECGENAVNGGSLGLLDGFSLAGAHEYAEVLTDQSNEEITGGGAGGWQASSHYEAADECEFNASGNQTGSEVSMGNGSYAMPYIWSNDTNGCAISHTVLNESIGTPQFTSSTVESCNGKYLVTWSSVANATGYQLSANYPPYAGYQVLKTVTGTSTSLKAADSTQGSDFEVQACDANGCSFTPSDPLELPYYSGCP